MERVIITEGTKVSLYTLFEDLQDYEQTNIQRWLFSMVQGYGIIAQLNPNGNGTIYSGDTSFYVSNIGGQYVTVSPGEAITSGLSYLSISSPTTIPTTGLTDGTHTLYLSHLYNLDTLVPVQSGFAYAQGATVDSREHDYTQLVWDTNPGASGVVLADVQIFSHNPTSVTDRRQQNILSFKAAMNSYSHLQNTDTSTTSSTFKINGAAGSNVLSQADIVIAHGGGDRKSVV